MRPAERPRQGDVVTVQLWGGPDDGTLITERGHQQWVVPHAEGDARYDLTTIVLNGCARLVYRFAGMVTS